MGVAVETRSISLGNTLPWENPWNVGCACWESTSDQIPLWSKPLSMFTRRFGLCAQKVLVRASQRWTGDLMKRKSWTQAAHANAYTLSDQLRILCWIGHASRNSQSFLEMCARIRRSCSLQKCYSDASCIHGLRRTCASITVAAMTLLVTVSQNVQLICHYNHISWHWEPSLPVFKKMKLQVKPTCGSMHAPIFFAHVRLCIIGWTTVFTDAMIKAFRLVSGPLPEHLRDGLAILWSEVLDQEITEC